MDPVYLDLHIHTSADPEHLNVAYDLATLKEKVDGAAQGSPALISLTDHNTINKAAYLGAVGVFDHLLLGAELHIRNFPEAPAYHCHIFFDVPASDEAIIDELNRILDSLYPEKKVTDADNIPTVETIVRRFDEYEFLLLPHGGQNHRTFNESIPDGANFDTALERSIYYNHFDGFTARNNRKLEKIHEYFEVLGIREFVNLVTSTDNYRPERYPHGKSDDAQEFIPTWMLAAPTFSGLRLSLSESQRLMYGKRPESWPQYIQGVRLKNDMIDVDVTLTPGLNVVIGGSSSGKTLFVDSVQRRIEGSLASSDYLKTPYGVEEIEVDNPLGQTPHYVFQNYIMKICDQKDSENTIDRISLLKSVFPDDRDERLAIDNGLAELGESLRSMISAVAEIESLEDQLKRIPELSSLIVGRSIRVNPLKHLRPHDPEVATFEYSEALRSRHNKWLREIGTFLAGNPLIDHDETLVSALSAELDRALMAADLEASIRQVIELHADSIDEHQKAEDVETNTKKKAFGSLLMIVRRYMEQHQAFYESRDRIARFSLKYPTREVEAMGHRLSIVNEFELTRTKFLEVLNQMLKREYRLTAFDQITPAALFSPRFSKQAPKVRDHDDLRAKIMAEFQTLDRRSYDITTNGGKHFNELSAGWKTSVILDLVLGSHGDTAPLIIDQPEDNLASNYINSGLLKAIKNCKQVRQVILVSHNATIPMLGDAQNVVVCRNDDNVITIRSAPLEGAIGNDSVLDLIARTTDGGKASIKKRVKKYNLKRFRGTDEAAL